MGARPPRDIIETRAAQFTRSAVVYHQQASKQWAGRISVKVWELGCSAAEFMVWGCVRLCFVHQIKLTMTSGVLGLSKLSGSQNSNTLEIRLKLILLTVVNGNHALPQISQRRAPAELVIACCATFVTAFGAVPPPLLPQRRPPQSARQSGNGFRILPKKSCRTSAIVLGISLPSSYPCFCVEHLLSSIRYLRPGEL